MSARASRGDRSKVRSLTPEQGIAVTELACELASRIRQHRTRHNLTQAQLGQLYGVSGERINHIEKVTNPNLSFGTAIRMLDDCGYTLAIVKKEPQP